MTGRTSTVREHGRIGPADGEALGPELFATADRARLCYQDAGDGAAPAILLVGGLGSSMDWWPADLCAELVASGRRVLRYDHRDTGRSTLSAPGKPDYTDRDLAHDALRVLDASGVEHAHLVGLSMGGAFVQRLAIERPDRVASVTLVATTRAVDSPGRPTMPPPSPEVAGLWGTPGPDPTDTAAVVAALVAEDRVLTGRGSFDAARTRAVATRAVHRSADPTAGARHAEAGPGGAVHGTLADIAAQTLVVHGAQDPLFPGHGELLADEIPGSRLLVLADMGHQVPPPETWDQFLPEVLRHTSP
ncbi:alpha/beta fold hydrolase [Isoptericola croceus]|uniref:alpha/beta fold hydrolase n=1 Tax=Isoptericola croceus TaxID=3031406 RepID=UPI0023F70677|nr:alpha/beta fold hydrolase [Isoptericola croceus]